MFLVPYIVLAKKKGSDKTEPSLFANVISSRVRWYVVLSGSTPYENIRGRVLPERLKKGGRLPRPDNADDT